MNQNNDKSNISNDTPQSETPNPRSDKAVDVVCVKRAHPFAIRQACFAIQKAILRML